MAKKGHAKNVAKSRQGGKDRTKDYESERIIRSMRSREHMAMPVLLPSGRISQSENSEELTRHLFSKIAKDVIQPPVRKKREPDIPIIQPSPEQIAEQQRRSEARRPTCPRCHVEQRFNRDGKCYNCGVSYGRKVKRP